MSGDLLERFKAFSTCQVADAFDKLKIRGHMHDIIMFSPDPGHRMAGPAHTVQMIPAGGGGVSKPAVHHVDSAPAGSVLVISMPAGVTTANWGGMMTTRAKVLGLAGVVLDGRARDVDEHREMGFPVFARGLSVHGSSGYTQVGSVGEPISSAGTTVREGDFILGDVNGVVVIPRERAGEILAKIEELALIEDKITAELEAGASIGETFAKYRG
jgi:regulator of RNase E activity RraA